MDGAFVTIRDKLSFVFGCAIDVVELAIIAPGVLPAV
jgi:hypothetical protein